MKKPDGRCLVEVRNRQREVRFSINKKAVQGIVQVVLDESGQQASCVGIHFISDRKTRQLHQQFFSDPSPTDCMSFPIDESSDLCGHRHLGDVFVCPATAYARARGKAAFFWKELTLYVVHGLFHLLGEDDTTPKARTAMRKSERRAMAEARRRGILLSGLVTQTKKYA